MIVETLFLFQARVRLSRLVASQASAVHATLFTATRVVAQLGHRDFAIIPKAIMQTLSRVKQDDRAPERAGVFGFECLCELGLLWGGMAVVVAVLLLLTQETDALTDRMTSAFKAEAAGQARASLPVYHLCVQVDQQSAWLRRGYSSPQLISLTNVDVQDQIPLASSHVSTSAHSLNGRVHAYGTTPEASLVVIRDGLTCIEEHYSSLAEEITALAVTADGSWVAAVNDRHTITLLNVTRSPPDRVEVLMESTPLKVSWSARKDFLLCACANGSVNMLAADGKIVWERNHLSQRMTSVAWAPDGDRVAVGASGGELAVLNATNGDLLWQSRLDSIQVSAVSFSTDGKLLALGGFDCTVDIISSANGTRLLKLSGHLAMITAVQFLSDGDRILSASLDGTLRLWSLSERRELQKL